MSVRASSTTHQILSSNTEYYTGSWAEECSGSQPSDLLDSFSLTPSFVLINYTHLTLPALQVCELYSKQYNRHCISASGKTMPFSTTKSFFDSLLKLPKSCTHKNKRLITMELLNRPTRDICIIC